MTGRRMVRLIGAVSVAGGLTFGCGDVPTLQDGVAYITGVELPLPAVAAGDTLRDSLGRAAPLRVRAFGRDSQEITGLEVSFLPTVLPAGVTIDANGVLVARDTVGSVQIVGRVGDRLQTTIATLQIVPEPTAIARPVGFGAGDTAIALPALRPFPVTVTGVFRGERATVSGIIVRYRIDSLHPRTLPAGSAILTNAAGAALRPDSTLAVDTTVTGGTATRSVLIRAGSGVQAVFVSASARRLRDGTPLTGSPVQVKVSVKP